MAAVPGGESDMVSILERLSGEMADVADRVRRSLVEVHNGRHGSGAGSIWHADGLILTNAHVVSGGPLQVALPDGSSIPATLIAHDGSVDLAALSVRCRRPAHHTPRRLEGPPSLAACAGHGPPLGSEGSRHGGCRYRAPGSPPGGPSFPGREWIAASLRLRPGHSDGPMMDAEGRLVGINTMITGPDVAMAVPVHVAKAFLRDKLRAQGA